MENPSDRQNETWHTKVRGTEIDPWLKEYLTQKTGGFRAARYLLCTNCRRWTLNGIDDDVAAFDATADPTPITPDQEFDCALTGRPTYTLGRTPGGAPAIESRDPHAIGLPTTLTVIPAHQCNGPHYPRTPKPTQNRYDTCPF